MGQLDASAKCFARKRYPKQRIANSNFSYFTSQVVGFTLLHNKLEPSGPQRLVWPVVSSAKVCLILAALSPASSPGPPPSWRPASWTWEELWFCLPSGKLVAYRTRYIIVCTDCYHNTTCQYDLILINMLSMWLFCLHKHGHASKTWMDRMQHEWHVNTESWTEQKVMHTSQLDASILGLRS